MDYSFLMDKNKIVELLDKTFQEEMPDVETPCDCQKCKKAIPRTVERNKLNDNQLRAISNMLKLFKADVFRYYLPKLLKISLENKAKIDFHMVVENLIIYEGNKGIDNYVEKRLDSLSRVQANVILEIINYWRDDHMVDSHHDQELEKSLPYWRKRANRNI